MAKVSYISHTNDIVLVVHIFKEKKTSLVSKGDDKHKPLDTYIISPHELTARPPYEERIPYAARIIVPSTRELAKCKQTWKIEKRSALSSI